MVLRSKWWLLGLVVVLLFAAVFVGLQLAPGQIGDLAYMFIPDPHSVGLELAYILIPDPHSVISEGELAYILIPDPH